MPPAITAVRHLETWVTDLAASRAWYERVFGLVHETVETPRGWASGFRDPDGVQIRLYADR